MHNSSLELTFNLIGELTLAYIDLDTPKGGCQILFAESVRKGGGGYPQIRKPKIRYKLTQKQCFWDEKRRLWQFVFHKGVGASSTLNVYGSTLKCLGKQYKSSYSSHRSTLKCLWKKQ